jgi:L-threonylcarbamoyladenylate synthase
MNTLHLQARKPEDCERAAALLRSGAVVAIPTETVYGLAADARQPQAVKAIFAAKERPRTHPLIVHLQGSEVLHEWAAVIPQEARVLTRAFWPGPLTILLHKHPRVDNSVTGGLATIALRVPDHPVLLPLIKRLGTGLAAPSANLHKQLSPTSAEQVHKQLDGRIAAVLDGGPCKVGLESTIIDLTVSTPRILRSGPITRGEIQAVLQMPVELPQAHEVSVSGNMQQHYQPHAPLHVLNVEALATKANTPGRWAILTHSTSTLEIPGSSGILQVRLPADKESYARELYAALFRMDLTHPDAILLEMPPQGEQWLDVNDRLKKAATIFG